MASVTILKHTQNAIYGQGRHNYREAKNYANGDIQLDIENVNLDESCKSSKELYRKIKERVAEIDAVLPPLRKRNDRIVATCFYVPAPREDTPDEEAEKFLREAYEQLKKKFGAENVMGGVIHKDERHTYRDPMDGSSHTSRMHLQAFVIPYMPEKGVNGKGFVKRGLYNQVNKIMDDICKKQLGISFRTGTGQKSRGTVERLKAEESLFLEQRNEELTQAIIQKERVLPRERPEKGEVKYIYKDRQWSAFWDWVEECRKKYKKDLFGNYKLTQDEIEHLIQCEARSQHQTEQIDAIYEYMAKLEADNERLVENVNKLKEPYREEHIALASAERMREGAAKIEQDLEGLVEKKVRERINKQKNLDTQLIELSKTLKADDGRSMFKILYDVFCKRELAKRQEKATHQTVPQKQEERNIQADNRAIHRHDDDFER